MGWNICYPGIILFVTLIVVTHTNGTSLILPCRFGKWRLSQSYSPFRDIRKNLFNHYSPRKTLNITHDVYYILYSNTYCEDHFWPIEHSYLCVECQPKLYLTSTRHCSKHLLALETSKFMNAVKSKCHGNWLLLSKLSPLLSDHISPRPFH